MARGARISRRAFLASSVGAIGSIELLVQAAVDAPEARGIEPGTIPAESRVAHVNRLVASTFDRGGENSVAHWRKAASQVARVYSLVDENEAPSESLVNELRWLADNEALLASTLHWPAERAVIIKRWLDANAEALASARRACACESNFAQLDPATQRLPQEDSFSELVGLRGLGRALGAAACSAARAGRWSEALAFNQQSFKLATYILTSPRFYWQLNAQPVAQLALEQLAVFLQGRPDEVRNAVAEIRRTGALRPPPESLLQHVEELFRRDVLELYLAWAADPSSQPAVSEEVQASLALPETMGESLPNSADLPKSPESFAAALNGAKSDEYWKTVRAVQAEVKRWDDLPLHQALRVLPEFRARVLEVSRGHPLTRYFEAVRVTPIESWRITRARTDLRAAGLEVVVALRAYRAARGRWPVALEDLVPAHLKEVPIDGVAGKPLSYSVRGGEFELVGTDWDTAKKASTSPLKLWPPAPPEWIERA